MKHEKYFSDFLSNHVDLNKTRVDRLEESVRAVTDFLQDSLNGYMTYSTQGSYAHKTIIKPVQDNDEFDADLLVFIKDAGFDPSSFKIDYVDKIDTALKESERYKSKIRKGTRCVTINYAGDFHLDIIPCMEHESVHYICNKNRKEYEKTDGDGYKKWLIDKNNLTGKNNFRKVTRLLKFLRDHKNTFSVKSILLTTLLGNEISVDNTSCFSDFPTSLKFFSEKINNFLQNNVVIPTIKNPVLSEENFNRHWDQEKYENFRNTFKSYTEKIINAFHEKDHNKSVKKWRDIFGENFGVLVKSSGKKGMVASSVSAKKPWAVEGND